MIFTNNLYSRNIPIYDFSSNRTMILSSFELYLYPIDDKNMKDGVKIYHNDMKKV